MSSRFEITPDMVDDDRYRFTPGLGRTRTGPRGRAYWQSRDGHNSSSSVSDRPAYDSYRPSTSSNEIPRYEPRYRVGTYDNPFRSGFPSSQQRAESERLLRERPLGSDRAAASEESREVEQGPVQSSNTNNFAPRSAIERPRDDADPSDLLSHTQLLNQLCAWAQWNRPSDDATDDGLFGWGDSRRSDEHLPGREVVDSRIKQESTEERDLSNNNRSVYTDNRRIAPNPQRRNIKPGPEADVASSIQDANMRSSPESSAYDTDSSNESRRRLNTTRDTSPLHFTIPPVPPPAIPGACMCPISKDCPARADHLIDCRTLVIEWKKWNAQQVGGDIEV